MNSILNSIKGRLFFWVFFSTTTLLIILGVSIYREVKKDILLSVELVLHSKIQILKGLLTEKDGEIKLERSEIALGEYSIPRSGHYYKVLVNRKVLAASPSLVEIEYELASGKLESFDEELKEKIFTSIGPADEPIMVIQHDFEIFDKPVTIFVARTLEDRLKLLNRFKNFLSVTVLVSIFIVAPVSLWIARQSLRPLKTFSHKIERITHKTLHERIDTKFQVKEIKGIAELFNIMLDRLRIAFDTEKRLIADASHKLKTPLSVIKTHCEVLLQKDRAKEEYILALSTIKTTSNNMERLIDNMLSLARLDSGILSTSRFTTVSLNGCIEKAIKLVDALAEKKQIKVSAAFSEDLKISGDQNAIIEAFLNIMENALKYNRYGGKVEISISKNNSHAKIVTEDNGMGIKEQDLDRIFDRFYRADTSSNTEGAGLGLSIAKAIIEAHNGEIKVESEVNKGSRFIVYFPLN